MWEMKMGRERWKEEEEERERWRQIREMNAERQP